ncbi:MAG: PQQ-dependent sugar dehydrogenase [Bacteroidota bacterium]
MNAFNALFVQIRWYALGSLLLIGSVLTAQTTITVGNTLLTERELAVGLQVPWEILWGPDDHIWVTEKRGRVLRIDPINGNTNTILNIETLVDSGAEPGLLGMVLHPDFDNSPFVYLVYNYLSGGFNSMERLVRYQWNGMELTAATILLDGIEGGGIHNGARLLISPDQKLLMTTGDVGSGNLSQNMNSLNGKLLRLNLDGSIPTDNPIPGSYIYSYGHRNAQGLAYGPNGQLYSSEHGAQSSDEFNLIASNRNYGWPNVQGVCNTSSEINFCNTFNVREPLWEWTPCVAVNGIEFYNHPAIPEWQGKMLMAVLGGFVQDPRLSVLSFNEDGTEVIGEEQFFDNYGRLRDLCVNPHNGAIYLATNGPFYPSNGPNRIIEYRNLDFVPTNTQEQNGPQQFIEVFPNPLRQTDQVHLRLSDNFIGHTLELLRYDGTLVKTVMVRTTDMQLPLQQLSAGSYYLRATNQTGTLTKTIVVQ